MPTIAQSCLQHIASMDMLSTENGEIFKKTSSDFGKLKN